MSLLVGGEPVGVVLRHVARQQPDLAVSAVARAAAVCEIVSFSSASSSSVASPSLNALTTARVNSTRPGGSSRLIIVSVWSDPAGPRGRLVSHLLRAEAATRPAAWGGLRPLDPSGDLAVAGFVVTRRAVVARRGYPSLVISARPRAG